MSEKTIYIICGIVSFVSLAIIIVAGTYPNIGG